MEVESMLEQFFGQIHLPGMVLSFFGVFLGLRFPDWDFKWKLRHRSIITHSPLFSVLLFLLYRYKVEESLFAYLVASFSFGIMLHMILDIFPHGWGPGTLLKIPLGRITCSPRTSKRFYFFTIVMEFLLVVFLLEKKEEYFLYTLFGILYLVLKIPKEKKFFRPAFLYVIFIALGALNFVDIPLK